MWQQPYMFDVEEELSSYLRDAESWKPEGVVVEAYKKNETGEYESVALSMCATILVALPTTPWQ
jgi:hypothetical protein